MKTTKEQLAEMLNGCERRNEMTREQKELAKANKLVVMFGSSDDNFEIEGAICDELGAYDGGEFALIRKGEMYSDEEQSNTYHKAEDDCVMPLSEDYAQPEEKNRRISLVWIGTGDDSKCWNITTLIPHAEFTVMEDGEAFSDAIVIDLDEVE